MLKLNILGLSIALLVAPEAYSSMLDMSDEELAQVQGQALMSLSYISPVDTKNIESTRTGSTKDIGFYKLGMEAEIELNVNIKKLQLGCGGANGVGQCDIDIDNLSLSGQKTLNGQPMAMTNEERAASSATLTNPFIEFAVKNPEKASLRQIVGFRLSAEKALGLLTAGTENSNVPNGINTISGYMKVQSDASGIIKGYASTAATRDNLYGSYLNPNDLEIRGRLQALGLGGAAEVTFKTSGGGFNIPQISNNYFEIPAIQVNGTRQSSTVLSAPVKVPNIYVGGPNDSNYPVNGSVTYQTSGNHDSNYQEPIGINTQGGRVEATVTSCDWLACLIAGAGSKFPNVYMSGTISNITANLNLTQSLGLIHNLPISSPFSLSLQNQALRWPGANADDVAQQGWWMSFADPVNIGYVIPQDPIDIAPLFPQIATAVTNFLNANPAQTSDLGGLLDANGSPLKVNIGTIDLKNSPLDLNISNLILTNQNFAPNCWGGLKFC